MRYAILLAMILAFCVGSTPALADTPEATRNNFENAGAKQTAKDFKPASDKIETSFGTLEFELEAFPTEETVRKIYDEMDLQRANQAYMDFMPALSVYGIVKSHIRDFGFRNSSDIVVAAGPGWSPNELYLTGNNATVYACASLDLKVEGPTVVEIPPGMYGTADDAAFKFLVDFGFVGPDKGEGGKYLFLPPGYEGDVPEGYFAINSPSYRIWVMMRGFGEVGLGDLSLLACKLEGLSLDRQRGLEFVHLCLQLGDLGIDFVDRLAILERVDGQDRRALLDLATIPEGIARLDHLAGNERADLDLAPSDRRAIEFQARAHVGKRDGHRPDRENGWLGGPLGNLRPRRFQVLVGRETGTDHQDGNGQNRGHQPQHQPDQLAVNAAGQHLL